MWKESGYGPKDVDVAQIYMNMNSMGIGAMVDHGFFPMEEAGRVLPPREPDRPRRRLPINTSGGDLGEGFIHGMGLLPEAVRQIRGTSTNQVPECQAVADDRRSRRPDEQHRPSRRTRRHSRH